MDLTDRIVELLQERQPLVIVKIYEVNRPELALGSVLVVTEKTVWGDYPVKEYLVQEARDVLKTGKTAWKSLTYDPIQLRVCFEIPMIQETLLIVGGGHIAVPLCKMAHIMGFKVVVLDDRQEYANKDRFPDAQEIILAPFAEGLNSFPVDIHTYVVLVTRGHTFDYDCLKVILNQNPAYIGMICSLRRREATFQLLKKNGYKEEQLERIYAPIGLPTGGESPEEIALSILAGIIAVRNRGKEWVWQIKKQNCGRSEP